MTVPFKDWLDLLAFAKKGPVYLPVAVRGLAYSQTFSVPGDYTTATVTGQVRSAPDADTALVTFTFGTPSFSAGRTTWAYSLAAGSGANSTGALPADDDGDGVQYFPFDFLLTPSGGSAERLFAGLLPVSGHITEPA